MSNLKPKKGLLLIAEPSLTGDSSFSRSVVLLADHSKEGSVGFILNKPLSYMVYDLIEDIKVPIPVFKGGPVDQDCLYFIHRVPDLIENSIEISHGVYWGGNFTDVVKLLNNNIITHNDIRFFLGYSGWDEIQLASEIEENSWILVDNDYRDDVIEKSCEELWKENMNSLGGDYVLWSNAPDDPNLN